MILLLKAQLSRWNAWQGLSTNRRIFSAMLVVGVMTGVASLAMVAKELVIAHFFGTSQEVDAFLIAFTLPMFAVSILAGSFSSAVMPTYIQVKAGKGEEAAKHLFSSLLALVIPFLMVVALVLALSGPLILPILGSGFSAETQALTLSLFYWLLPVLVLSGISHLYATAINAGEQFGIVALAPGVTPLCAVISLMLFLKSWGIHALAGGTTVGAIIEAAILARVAAQRGIPLLPRWGGMTDDLRKVLGQYSPMVAGAFLMSSTVLVDRAMAAMLEPGSVATLNYANRVVTLFLGLGAMALGTAVLPHFSHMVAKNDWPGIRHTFNTYMRFILLFSIPLTFVLVLFSERIIGVLFQRGAFSVADTLLVSQVQSYYLLQIPFYILGILGVRLLSAYKMNETLMKISCLSFFGNIVLNYVLIRYFYVAGIALSTSITYLFSLVMITWSIYVKGEAQ